jgi:hypothetical protein
LKIKGAFMKVTKLSLVLCLSLTGCLVQKNPTGNISNESNTIIGDVVIRDLHGKALEKPKGEVLAQFVKPSQSRASFATKLLLPPMSTPHSKDRGTTQCKISRTPNHSGAFVFDEDRSATALTVGEVSFGTGQSDLTPLQEDTNHLYQLSLQPNFPGGIYYALVKGTSTAPHFSLKMAMPESMNHVLAQGQDFETSSSTAFRKSETLQLSWDAPTTDLDIQSNQMELVVVSQNDQETVQLVCGILEKDLMANSPTVNWAIPNNYLQGLDATTKGLLVLKRAQLREASSASIGVVDVESLRVYATNALIAE